MNRGILYGIAAYLLWGIFPIYWKLIASISPLEILLNRIVWSFIFLLVILFLQRNWTWIQLLRNKPKLRLVSLLAALLLAVNWFRYIWGVTNGFIVEASLGYFINPVVSVLLGVVVLRERLRPLQISAVLIATLGVLYLTIGYNSLPWIALILAFTFGFYGLIKKQTLLGSVESLSTEMTVLVLPALIGLLTIYSSGNSSTQGADFLTYFLLVASGIVTTVPLILFALAARRIPLSTIGFLQYIAPTMQFLIGVLVYNEDFSTVRMIGFGIIWLALIIYTFDNLRNREKNRKIPVAAD
jgi:chloramphenicol-sensitive protein RarD